MANINLPSYRTARQSARSNYAAIAAMQNLARSYAQQRGSRDLWNLGQKYEVAVPRTIAAYSQRNLAGPNISSGVYSRGLQNLASNQAAEQYNIQSSLAEQMQKIQARQDQAYRNMQDKLANIDLKKARDIANQAASLRSFKPFLGG